ncbi:hypothetical protein MIMGU_mgv1a0204862mg, partial [Erythranthe guttata]
NNGNGTYLIL